MNEKQEMMSKEIFGNVKGAGQIPLTDGWEKCVGLTRGLVRAAPENLDKVLVAVLRTIISLGFSVIIFITVFRSGSSGLDSFFGLIFSMLAILVITYLYYVRILNIRELLLGNLNEIYHKVDSFLATYLEEEERILVTLVIGKPVNISFTLNPIGLMVLTTHRGILLSTNANLATMWDVILQPNVVAIEVFDYSNPANLLPSYPSRNIFAKYNTAGISIRPVDSVGLTKWNLMPIKGTNYRLFEAILERRDSGLDSLK